MNSNKLEDTTLYESYTEFVAYQAELPRIDGLSEPVRASLIYFTSIRGKVIDLSKSLRQNKEEMNK